MKKIKISELPLCTELSGLYTLGTDANNNSVKVPFEMIDGKIAGLSLRLAGLHILPVDGIGIVGDDIFPSETPGFYWDTEDREFIGQPFVNGYEQEDYFAQDVNGDWVPRTDRIFSCGGALYHIVDGQMVPLHQADLDALATRVTTADKRLAGVAILPIDATVNLGTVAGAQQEGVRFDTRAGAFVGDFDTHGYAEEDYNEKYSESELVLPRWRARRDRIYRCGAELYHITETGALKPLHATKAELSEAVEDIGHRLVGIWDELDSVKEALAALSSPRLDQLLARLGYDEADIREFRYALLHFDLGLTLDDIELAVMRWEARAELSYPLGLKLMPKWGAGCEWTDSGEFASLKDLAEAVNFNQYNGSCEFTYIPHIGAMECAEAQAFLNLCSFVVFFGGVDIIDTASHDSRLIIPQIADLRGVGRIFAEDFYAYNKMQYIGKARINICKDAFYNTEIQDFRGVEFREDSPRWSAPYIFARSEQNYVDTMIGDWDFGPDKLLPPFFTTRRIIKDSVLNFDWWGSLKTQAVLNYTGLNGCTLNIKNFDPQYSLICTLGRCSAVANPTTVNFVSMATGVRSVSIDLGIFHTCFDGNFEGVDVPGLSPRKPSHFEVHLHEQIVSVECSLSYSEQTFGYPMVYIFDYGGCADAGTVDLINLLYHFAPGADGEMLLRSVRTWNDRTAAGLPPCDVYVDYGMDSVLSGDEGAELAAKGYNIIVSSH